MHTPVNATINHKPSKQVNKRGFCDCLWQHCASTSPYPKRKQICELLLRKGANVNEKNKEWVSHVVCICKGCLNDCVSYPVMASGSLCFTQLSHTSASCCWEVPQWHHWGVGETWGESKWDLTAAVKHTQLYMSTTDVFSITVILSTFSYAIRNNKYINMWFNT